MIELDRPYGLPHKLWMLNLHSTEEVLEYEKKHNVTVYWVKSNKTAYIEQERQK